MGRTSNHVSFKTCILKCHGCEYNKARIVTQEDPMIDRQWTLKLYLFNLYWRCMYEEIFVIIFLLCANTRCIIVYGPNTHWRSLVIFSSWQAFTVIEFAKTMTSFHRYCKLRLFGCCLSYDQEQCQYG